MDRCLSSGSLVLLGCGAAAGPPECAQALRIITDSTASIELQRDDFMRRLVQKL